jgi:hypothetical protein
MSDEIRDEADELMRNELLGLINKNEPLVLSNEEFELKLLQEPHGYRLLNLFNAGEYRVCMRHGLYEPTEDGRFRVNHWSHLVGHLRIVAKA